MSLLCRITILFSCIFHLICARPVLAISEGKKAAPSTLRYDRSFCKPQTAESALSRHLKKKPLPLSNALTLKVGRNLNHEKVPLSWTRYNRKDFYKYKLHRSKNAHFTPNDNTLVDIFDSIDKTTFDDEYVEPHTTYYYKVLAYNEAGAITRSNEIRVTTLAKPQPIKLPSPVLKAKALSMWEVTLTWTQYQAGDFERYELHRSTTARFRPSQKTLLNMLYEAKDNKDIDPYGDKGITYYYKVVVYNQENLSGVSNEVKIDFPIPLKTAPPLPVVLQEGASPTNSRVFLSWTKSNDKNFVIYEVHRSTVPHFTPDKNTRIALVPYVDKHSYIDKDVESTTKYYYTIVVLNYNIQQAASNEIQVTTTAPPTTPGPSAVTIKLGDHVTDSEISLLWTKSQAKDFDRYELYYSKIPNFALAEGGLVAVFERTYETQFTDGDLAADTTYYYKIVLYNQFEQSAVSNEVRVTTAKAKP